MYFKFKFLYVLNERLEKTQGGGRIIDVFLSIRKINLHALAFDDISIKALGFKKGVKKGFLKTADISLFLFFDIPASPLIVVFFLSVFFIIVFVFSKPYSGLENSTNEQ
ncbi:hypothetical protein C1634_024805 [Chryseobacterium viscerum]|uniref:Uncharacterized protein n=1 Tax=Chryseobacterium viscerum TaxID=1037377 RepID=A0A316WCG4_9FLAO|nr:hypothetical protein C1634_024805 [Chryseobacterium viscerum]